MATTKKKRFVRDSADPKDPKEAEKKRLAKEEILRKVEEELASDSEDTEVTVEETPEPEEHRISHLHSEETDAAVDEEKEDRDEDKEEVSEEEESAVDKREEERDVEASESEEPDERSNDTDTSESEERSEPETTRPAIEDYRPAAPIVEEKKRSFLWTFLLLVLVGFLAGIGFLVYQEGKKQGQKEAMANISPTPVPVTPTPTTAVALTEYSIEVQNGSGTSGAARKAEGELNKAGFKVDSVGNADNSNYEDTVIRAKKSVPEDYLVDLTNALKKEGYTVAEETEELPATEDVDVIVVIGKGAL